MTVDTAIFGAGLLIQLCTLMVVLVGAWVSLNRRLARVEALLESRLDRRSKIRVVDQIDLEQQGIAR